MRHLILLLALLSASCSSTLPSFKTYKLDVQQGNVVTSKMMLQLKPGMTKSQVRYVMGTPLLQDSFHPDRWDYLYQMNKDGRVIERRRVILEFGDEGLKTVRGDVIPAGQPGAEGAAIASVEDVTTATSNKALLNEDPKKSWADRFKFWADDEPVKKAAPKVSDKPIEKSVAKVAEPVQAAEVVEAPAVEAQQPVVAENVAEQAVAPKIEEVKAIAENLSDSQLAAGDVEPEKSYVQNTQEPVVADDKNQLVKRVAAWADAWRKKNIEEYLSFYSNQFKPEGLSKKAWVVQRKQRLSAKQGDIKLSLDNVVVRIDGKQSNVEFVQHYSTSGYSDHVVKVLAFEREKTEWMIVKESVTGKASSVKENVMPEVVEPVEVGKPREVTVDEKTEGAPVRSKKPDVEPLVAPVEKPAIKAPEPLVQPKPEAKPVQRSVDKAVEQPVAKPQAGKDKPLPAEDEPGYFERMLEKIGF